MDKKDRPYHVAAGVIFTVVILGLIAFLVMHQNIKTKQEIVNTVPKTEAQPIVNAPAPSQATDSAITVTPSANATNPDQTQPKIAPSNTTNTYPANKP